MTKTKKIVLGIIVLLLTGSFTFGSLALAKASPLNIKHGLLSDHANRLGRGQEIVHAYLANGQVYALIRGQVESVNVTNSSFVLKSLGGPWIINVGSDTKFFPENFKFSEIKAQDFLTVRGLVPQDKNWTIEAKFVKSWLPNTNEPQPRRLIQALGKIYTGTIGTLSLSDTSFTLTTEKQGTLTVKTSADTKLIDRNWEKISFIDLKSGDSARVFGRKDGDKINALIVRDLSIPR